MSDRLAAFQATYSDMRLVRSRKVVQIVMEIPLEQWTEASQVLGGMPNPASETWVAIARLETNIKPKPVPETKNGDWNSLALAQQAGILCSEGGFQRFLGATDKTSAADIVRTKCGIVSRGDLRRDTPAGDKWLDLVAQYRGWCAAPAVGVEL